MDLILKLNDREKQIIKNFISKELEYTFSLSAKVCFIPSQVNKASSKSSESSRAREDLEYKEMFEYIDSLVGKAYVFEKKIYGIKT